MVVLIVEQEELQDQVVEEQDRVLRDQDIPLAKVEGVLEQVREQEELEEVDITVSQIYHYCILDQVVAKVEVMLVEQQDVLVELEGGF